MYRTVGENFVPRPASPNPTLDTVRFEVGWDWLGHVSDPTPARFFYPCAGHTSTTTTTHV